MERTPAEHGGRCVKTPKSLGIVWVCVCCYVAHRDGEDEGCDHCGYEPLSKIGDCEVTTGMAYDEHESECLHKTLGWDVPGAYECDCERRSFSQSPCEGCGNHLGGERNALTLWQ